jgi:hypothetical protein
MKGEEINWTPLPQRVIIPRTEFVYPTKCISKFSPRVFSGVVKIPIQFECLVRLCSVYLNPPFPLNMGFFAFPIDDFVNIIVPILVQELASLDILDYPILLGTIYDSETRWKTAKIRDQIKNVVSNLVFIDQKRSSRIPSGELDKLICLARDFASLCVEHTEFWKNPPLPLDRSTHLHSSKFLERSIIPSLIYDLQSLGPFKEFESLLANEFQVLRNRGMRNFLISLNMACAEFFFPRLSRKGCNSILSRITSAIIRSPIYQSPCDYESLFVRDAIVLIELQNQISDGSLFRETFQVEEDLEKGEGLSFKNQILRGLKLEILEGSYNVIDLAVQLASNAHPLLKPGLEDFINVFLGKFRSLVFDVVKTTRSFMDVKEPVEDVFHYFSHI